MHEYVAERRAYYRASNASEVAAALARAETVQAALWNHAIAVATQHPDWDVMSVYLEALNLMFDLEAARTLAESSMTRKRGGRLSGAARRIRYRRPCAALGRCRSSTGR